MPAEYDVAIVGGGPAGTTAAALLKKYNPDLSVVILEKEKFPRDHVGESQLPMIGRILHEMGCWEKVEAAGFPIKVGATYRWGQSPELWDFNFAPPEQFENLERPGKYEGVRIATAWQVDRARYDTILLDHAREIGCDVFEETGAECIVKDDDPNVVDHLTIKNNGDTDTVRARYYVDASGRYGSLRRALPIKVDTPGSLKNIAFWDYWDNAEWAVEIGVGGTRVQILSIGSGWIWFIPLGPTRTSIGFVCPAEFFKDAGKEPEELYLWALSQQPRVTELTKNATRRGMIEGTKDWSFTTDRMAGENWFLAGESAGFADPILAGGMMLTHSSARHCAYVILELERGELDSDWLKSDYSTTQLRRIAQHIRFADFWYAANGQFDDLKDLSAKIAADIGLHLRPDDAFRWLSTGGFSDDYLGAVGIGGLDIGAVKQLATLFGQKQEAPWEISKYNRYTLNIKGASKTDVSVLQEGRIHKSTTYLRGDRRLPTFGLWGDLIDAMAQNPDLQEMSELLKNKLILRYGDELGRFHLNHAMQMLEVMLVDGWVRAKVNKKRPLGKHLKSSIMTGNFAPNTDEVAKRVESGG